MTVSRQRTWQLKRRAAGLCTQCGAERSGNATYCDQCRQKAAKIKRIRRAKQATTTLTTETP